MQIADPRSNVLRLGLRSGMKVADLGAGTGHYTLAAAAIVDDGRVYAIEVQPEMLEHITDAAKRAGCKNIEVIHGDFEKRGGTKLKDGILDAVIMSNVLFQIEAEHWEIVLTEVKRILKSGGKLLVIDWAGSYGGMGPATALVVTEHTAEEKFITAGFHKVTSFRAGAHHYAIIFEKP